MSSSASHESSYSERKVFELFSSILSAQITNTATITEEKIASERQVYFNNIIQSISKQQNILNGLAECKNDLCNYWQQMDVLYLMMGK
jgi:light-regulated signal transduction histidine kinase (bacteriophytochrome)